MKLVEVTFWNSNPAEDELLTWYEANTQMDSKTFLLNEVIIYIISRKADSCCLGLFPARIMCQTPISARHVGTRVDYVARRQTFTIATLLDFS